MSPLGQFDTSLLQRLNQLDIQELAQTQQNTPSTMAPTHLFDLPVEIKTQILSNLPATEILRARKVSKHVRDLIDEPSNQPLLLPKHRTTEAQNAITHLYDTLINFDPAKTDLLELHDRFLQHRYGNYEEADWEVSNLYCNRLGFISGMEAMHLGVPHDEILFKVVDTILRALNEVQDRPGPNFASKRWERKLTRKYGQYYDALNLSPEKLRDFYKRVAKRDNIRLDKPLSSYAAGMNRDYLFPNFPLHKPETQKRLGEILGVPPMTRRLAIIFHYGVKTRWAYDKVKEALDNPDINIPDFELAAIRDEVFMYYL